MSKDPGVRPDSPDPEAQPASGKKQWKKPAVTELPRLTDLTLQTGGPIGGGGNDGGSTVF
jgi:hypothetical protein